MPMKSECWVGSLGPKGCCSSEQAGLPSSAAVPAASSLSSQALIMHHGPTMEFPQLQSLWDHCVLESHHLHCCSDLCVCHTCMVHTDFCGSHLLKTHYFQQRFYISCLYWEPINQLKNDCVVLLCHKLS